jgi:surfactin synthase thioesterase subunit
MPARPDPLLDLFVFPCVGGSAVVMYESWAALLPDFIQVRFLIFFVRLP